MNTRTATPPPRATTRGSHAERSASMRQRLIEAAIACLRRVGYAATTTQLVMDEAGVSRGAMLHHFPTKIDLMIAVGEFAADRQDQVVRDYLEKIGGSPMDAFLGVTAAAWEAIVEPPAQAFVEILMASRSDPALNERFPAVAERIEATQQNRLWEMASGLGITDRDAIERMVRLHTAAMRGLVIELMYANDRSKVDQAVELLDWYKRRLTGELLTLGDTRLLGDPS